MKKRWLIIIGLFIPITLFFVTVEMDTEPSSTNLPVQVNSIPNTTASESIVYSFSDTKPNDYVRLDDTTTPDRRAFSMALIDPKLKLVKSPNNSYLVLENPANPEQFDYKIYSDTELLYKLKNGTASLYDKPKEKKLDINVEGKTKTYTYFEQTLGTKVLQKYIFSYMGVEYLIAVDFETHNKAKYLDLTYKILATMLPHTASLDSFMEKFDK